MASEQAEFSFYLFENGQPKSNIELQIDGRPLTKTDRDGYIGGKISAGTHTFTFIKPQKNRASWIFKRDFIKGENAQFIVSFFKNGALPTVEIATSRRNSEALNTTESQQLKAPTAFGSITGIVTSAETQKPVNNAQIYISGIAKQIRTDNKGQFKLAKIPVGQYSISVLHPAFNSKVQEGIQVTKDTDTSLTLSVAPVGVDLPEFVVLEPFLAGSIASVIEEQKSSAGVSSVLGAEQISRAGDSDVASALKRVSGLTLVEGKYVFIRGLGERYSTTMVNGSLVPSPDPTRRVVPLDLFPTSILDSLLVSKAYLPSLPAEFAGGTVEIRTRNVPEDFFFRFSGKIGGSEGTTFDKGLSYRGGKDDSLGIDDGTRALPDSIASATSGNTTIKPQTRFNPDGFTPQEIEKFGEDLSHIWDIDPKTIPLNGRVQASIGDLFTVGDFSFGYMAAARWDEKWNIQNEQRRLFATGSGNSLILKKDFQVDRTLHEVNLNGYLALEARYLEDHKIYVKLLAIRQSTDEARIEGGFTDSEDFDIRRTTLKWKENQLLNNQVGGEHLFPMLNDLEFKWSYTNSTASRYAPNERHYRYDDANRDGNYSFSRRADNNQSIFANLDDKSENWRFDISLPVNIHQDVTLKLLTGLMNQTRSRDSKIRRYHYSSVGPDASDPAVLGQPSLEDVLSPENIGPNGFQLLETTRSTDNYQASQDLLAVYGQVDLMLYDSLRLNGGLRWEDNDQVVETFAISKPDKDPVRTQLKKADLVPAITGTWIISEKQQFRASWSNTLSRPDFRELSPAPFTDPLTNSETVGNPDLVQTYIANYDARWEYYFSPKENFALGFFWKDLENPIEKVFVPGSGGLLTYQNAKSARVFGIELEILKNLDFIHPDLEYFFAGSNYTWSKSSVELTAENLLAQTSSARPLQGHSPHLFNLQFGYDNPDWGTQATILYNVAAARIVEAGQLGAPDKYQQPFNQLDFVYRQRLSDWFSINVRMKNLLDDTSVIMQGDKITRSYKKGREYSLTLSLNF
ncbi:TonB-dependent receptor, homolog 3 [methanotrophic endosymbiont of Bathymodiolus puteoserpentis (Logatchev)]|nr:TonB-dependent receptor, homolog 3 [methanotrophic endosymbiont of Bathymodiolus puteoserpentis (Logatchev)]